MRAPVLSALASVIRSAIAPAALPVLPALLCLVSTAGVSAMPAAAQMTPAPVRVGGAIKVPPKLFHVSPVYPAEAERAHVSGIVILEVTLDVRGDVADVRVLRGV